ncbi:MAG: thioredoxin family protein [Chitinispirillaceae bacterium]|nr:thioredoxin family protein [Chitinispirillaceae bacterium]
MKSNVSYALVVFACIALGTCVNGPGIIDSVDSPSVIELDTASLIKILQSDTVAMIDFYSPTCRYCIQSAWIIDSLNKVYGDTMLFAKMNTELDSLIWEHFQLTEIPTFVFYHNGQEYARRTYHEIQGPEGEYDSLAVLAEEVLALTNPGAIRQKKERPEL